MTQYVGYIRVSTKKQGNSGLGLEAQEAAILAHVKPTDRLILPNYIEVESGKRSDRPQLTAALEQCKRTGSTLLIAKLDRLARNVAFISTLMETGVPFVACDRPNAGAFELHIFAALAEQEAKDISARTKSAFAAAKLRGAKLGGDRGYYPHRDAPEAHRKGVRLGAAASAEVRKGTAMRLAYAARDAIAEAREVGATSLHQIADQLNEVGVATTRGGKWTATAVKRVLARLEAV